MDASLRALLPLALLGTLAAQAAPTPTPGTTVPEILVQLRKIESARLRGESELLRVGFQEQARNRPSDVMLRIYLAWCAFPSEDSWNQLKAISAIYPENPWVNYGMGRVYTRWKMKDQAANAFAAALKSDARFYPAMVGQAELLAAGEKLDEAALRFRAALAIHDDAEARTGLGLVLLRQGKSDDARAELAKGLGAWPDQPLALDAAMKLAREADDKKAAVEVAARLCDLTPKDPAPRRALADLRYDLGEKEQAAVEYERFLRSGGMDRDVLKRLAGLYRAADKAQDEERIMQQLSGLEKDVAEHPVRLAELAEARGAMEDAEAQMLEAAARDPKRGDLWLKVGQLRMKKDMVREALEAFRQAQVAGGETAGEAAKEVKTLSEKLKLPAKPAKGSVDAIYAAVSASLLRFFEERTKAKPELGGKLRYRVRVGATGQVEGVDVLEDSVGEPLLTAHAYFGLRDAAYPAKRREPVFEFDLKPPKKAK